MKIVVAPDSLKESLTAAQTAQAIERGIKSILPTANVVLLPIADGGEGTVSALVTAANGEIITSPATDPLGKKIYPRWGILEDGTAVIEMAAASGLPLVPPKQRNPMITTTYGTGQLIKAALDRGCRRIILGLGGSATNDGGAGVITALGARLLDFDGNEIASGPSGLMNLATIDLSYLDPRLKTTHFDIACDVSNPLTGPLGASHVFGPQKGADAKMINEMDSALTHFASVALANYKDIANFPGSGAAGGLAAGLSIVASIKIKPGIDLILEAMSFSEHLRGADLVFTAEGKIDGQSMMGKAIFGIANLAHKAGVPTVALCGSIGLDHQELYKHGISAIVPIVDSPMTLAEAMEQAPRLVESAAARVIRLLLVAKC